MGRTGEASGGRARTAARVALAAVLTFATTSRAGGMVECGNRADVRRIDDALAALRGSVDPCGGSDEILATLEAFERCPSARYAICTGDARRNLFERPAGVALGTITWNPGLRSDLEPARGGRAAVARDPVASLLHEIAHAAQDCAGLNPGEHELEAVRVENVYRRAAGLPQRTRYGDLVLPPAAASGCPATAPVPAGIEHARGARDPRGRTVADGPGGIPADPAR